MLCTRRWQLPYSSTPSAISVLVRRARSADRDAEGEAEQVGHRGGAEADRVLAQAATKLRRPREQAHGVALRSDAHTSLLPSLLLFSFSLFFFFIIFLSSFFSF